MNAAHATESTADLFIIAFEMVANTHEGIGFTMRTWGAITEILAPYLCRSAVLGNAMYGYPLNRFSTEMVTGAIEAAKAASVIITAEGITDEAADLRAGLWRAIDRCSAELARRARAA
jgi:hypothetical protein